jgi:hypothetical protein
MFASAEWAIKKRHIMAWPSPAAHIKAVALVKFLAINESPQLVKKWRTGR